MMPASGHGPRGQTKLLVYEHIRDAASALQLAMSPDAALAFIKYAGNETLQDKYPAATVVVASPTEAKALGHNMTEPMPTCCMSGIPACVVQACGL